MCGCIERRTDSNSIISAKSSAPHPGSISRPARRSCACAINIRRRRAANRRHADLSIGTDGERVFERRTHGRRLRAHELCSAELFSQALQDMHPAAIKELPHALSPEILVERFSMLRSPVRSSDAPGEYASAASRRGPSRSLFPLYIRVERAASTSQENSVCGGRLTRSSNNRIHPYLKSCAASVTSSRSISSSKRYTQCSSKESTSGAGESTSSVLDDESSTV